MCNDKTTEDERARLFHEIALPCLDDIYRLAYFLMRNRSDAEDAVQECYLRAWRHFESWSGTSIKPWLHAIARNVCLFELSGRDRKEMPADLHACDFTAEQLLWSEPPASAEAEMIAHDERETVRKTLLSLPSELREIIVLREFNDLSYREIAGIACVPIGTVMSRLSRARAAFAAAWKKADEEPSDGEHSPRTLALTI
ncbi:MAG TPA: sigma-70 family RNA polymerase sigma factor [Stellaceae bacterium]|jgi:RNA polymerase sigma-70 factor (ECF subfamily)